MGSVSNLPVKMADQHNTKPNEKPFEINDKTTVCDKKKDLEKDDGEKVDLGVPKDMFYVIYILIFLTGLVHYLPFSFFSTATKYWMYKLRNTSINDTNAKYRTDLQASFNASLKIVGKVSEIGFMILAMTFGRYVKPRTTLIAVLTGILIMFSIVTAFTRIDTDSWQEGFFVMIMAIEAAVTAMNAVFAVNLFSVLSMLPHHYLAPYLTGGGLSSIFTALLQILSLTAGMSTVNSALLYFLMGVLVILITLILLIATGRNKFYLYHMKKFKGGETKKRITFKEGFHLFKKIWSSVVMMGLFLLTIDASPTALVVSENEGGGPWNDLYFIPTITYLLHSVCGLIGRGIAFKFLPKINPIYYVIFSLIRFFVIIPLFMLCHAQPRHHLPVLLPHDYQYIILIIVANISGGYLTSLVSYNIATLVSKEELEHAYQVNVLLVGFETAVFSSVRMVSVKLL